MREQASGGFPADSASGLGTSAGFGRPEISGLAQQILDGSAASGKGRLANQGTVPHRSPAAGPAGERLTRAAPRRTAEPGRAQCTPPQVQTPSQAGARRTGRADLRHPTLAGMDQTEPAPRWLVLAVLCTGMLMVIVDTPIVSGPHPEEEITP
jgi:hypothetical protein